MSERPPSESQGKIVVFGAKKIRRAWAEEQWYFSVVDIVAALTDSPNPRNYWNMMKTREQKGSGVELSTFCVQLKLTSTDGRSYRTDCVNTENAFRIARLIPSPASWKVSGRFTKTPKIILTPFTGSDGQPSRTQASTLERTWSQ